MERTTGLLPTAGPRDDDAAARHAIAEPLQPPHPSTYFRPHLVCRLAVAKSYLERRLHVISPSTASKDWFGTLPYPLQLAPGLIGVNDYGVEDG